jgi:tripartite-type tricarboxylate transporter receptor subunit TctC
MQRRLQALTLQIALVVLAASPALAQTYPDRTVKIVVPFPAGGTADAVPRIVGDWLSRKWGQPVVIENKTGAAGNIGSETVYNAPPDGYTLLSAPPPPLVINHNLYPKLGFDPTKFEPIIVMAHVPNALIVNPNKIKASSVAELIAYLKENPGKVEAPAHPLSRVGAGAAGPSRRRRRLDVRQSRSLAAADDGRTTQAAGGRLKQPVACNAQRAHHRGDAARL